MKHLDTAYDELFTQSKSGPASASQNGWTCLSWPQYPGRWTRWELQPAAVSSHGPGVVQLHLEELREKLAVKLSPSIAVKEPCTQQLSNGVYSIGIFHNFTVWKVGNKKLILHHKGTLCSAGVTVDSTGTPSSFSLQQICYTPSFEGKGSLGNWRYYFNGQQNLHHSLSLDVDLPVNVTPPLDAEPTRKVSLPSGLFTTPPQNGQDLSLFCCLVPFCVFIYVKFSVLLNHCTATICCQETLPQCRVRNGGRKINLILI